jgi:N-acetylglucosaminyl-diphospho-decaprenol L-rhamnosyltransferase
MKLAVGFLTYNDITVRYLPDFLASLEAALRFLPVADYQVYAFDNSAPDETPNRRIIESFNRGAIGAAPRRPVQYLASGDNLGFSRAYNILIRAAARAGAEYFLIINPDTVLAWDAIAALGKTLAANPSLAAVAPKILRWDFAGGKVKTNIIDSLGLVLRPGLKFLDLGQGEEDQGQSATAAIGGQTDLTILGPTGAAGLFRLSALADIAEPGPDGARQYFDERFFMYKEDCDLAYRLFRSGHKSAVVPGAVIYHDRTAASAGAGLWLMLSHRRQKSRQIRAWSFRHQHYLFIKHWKNQNFVNHLLIIYRILFFFIFALILERFLLKEYFNIFRFSKGLTNIK